MVVLAVDDKFTIIVMSQAYLDTTMTRREDITGKGIFEAFPGNPDSPEETGSAELRHSLEFVEKNAAPHTMPLVKYDIRRADGTYEVKFWSATHTPIFDDDGNLTYILQHTEDVTALVRQEEKDAENRFTQEKLELKNRLMEAEILRRVQELESANARLELSEQKYRIKASEAGTWENRYSAAIQASGQIMFDWNPGTNEVLFAGNLKEILGYEIDEMTGPLENWLSIVHPEDIPSFNREIERVKEKREPFRLTFRVIRKDGRVIHCEDHGNFFRDSKDNILRMVGFVRDVTARLQIEEDLHVSRNRLSLAQKAGKMGAFEWNIKNGQIVWTPELEQLYGMEPGYFQGNLNNWTERLLPEDAERITHGLEQCMAEKVRNYHFEFRIKMPDGSLKWLAGQSSFFYDFDGNAERMVGVNYDIHERKETEQALLHSEQSLQLAVAIAQMGTFEIDFATSIVAVNSIGRQIFGWKNDTPITFERILSHFCPQDRESIIKTAQASCHSSANAEFAMEYSITTGEGLTRWLRVCGHTVYETLNGVETAKRSVGTFLDITREKEFNLQLEQARDAAIATSAAKSTFLATMSHELRTPLNAIIGYSEMLKEIIISDEVNKKEIVNDLNRISDSGEHLLLLISDILDFSKIEAGRMDLADDTINIENLIQVTVDSIKPLCNARNNSLIVTTQTELTQIRGDFMKLKQVLMNLLSNAAKFTVNGIVKLEYGTGISEQAETLWFKVSDTGIGIAEIHIPRMFESFQQLDSSHTRRHGGSGLGLAITKKLVERMNGTISITSTLGKGSIFTVELPLHTTN